MPAPNPMLLAQETLVKLFRDVYWKAGAPLSFPDELKIRSTVQTLVQAIRDEVIASIPQPSPLVQQLLAPSPLPGTGAGDPFPSKPAAVPKEAPAPEKRGFFSGLLKSQTVPDPHKKPKK